MQNNIPTVHISEIHCCIVKSSSLLNYFAILYKKYKKLKFTSVNSWQRMTLQREPAFSVGQL